MSAATSLRPGVGVGAFLTDGTNLVQVIAADDELLYCEDVSVSADEASEVVKIRPRRVRPPDAKLEKGEWRVVVAGDPT